MSRTTTEKKDAVIKVRISEELKDRLERNAKLKGVNLSEYIRDILKESVHLFN